MRLLAAFIFFTRLPFWKIKSVPQEYFKTVVNYWSIVGWLTGGIMAGVLWISMQIVPLSVSVLLAIIARLLITGALHEDGLADFMDGFGGGINKGRTLAIMKDSYTGSYGIIGLICYFLLLWTVISSLPRPLIFWVIIAADSSSKLIASQLINVLPYARKEEESKIKVIYNRMSAPAFLFSLLFGLAPVLLFLPTRFWLALILPCSMFFILYLLMKLRIQGYTGDCCGATFLLCELSFYIGILILAINFQT